MGAGGGATDQANAADQLSAYRRARAKAASGEWDSTALGAKPKDYDSWDKARQGRYLEHLNDYGDTPTNTTVESRYKGMLGDNYVDPVTGRSKSMPKVSPDLTDELLMKTRTSAWNRLQVGKNQNSSFAGTQLGGLDLSKPVLGGY